MDLNQLPIDKKRSSIYFVTQHQGSQLEIHNLLADFHFVI